MKYKKPAFWGFYVLGILTQGTFYACQAQDHSLRDSPPGKGKLIRFDPHSFSHRFSSGMPSVLSLEDGDTVITETIDALGFDKNGAKRDQGGNPLTGPFLIRNSAPGDMLAITFLDITLNRDYAYTSENLMPRALEKSSQERMRNPKPMKWKLDTSSGFASPDTLYPILKNLRVPLHPFLGCVGVAPEGKRTGILSFFQGNYGGNLDFKALARGATLYLPVFHEGAYLFMGDGHALQGDGELTGNALETSLDIRFSIRLIKGGALSLQAPRVEDSASLMVIGIGNALDGALQSATSGLLRWLEQSYRLSRGEATQVLSSSMEFIVAEIADPYVEIVAKIRKDRLISSAAPK
jgi:amidase